MAARRANGEGTQARLRRDGRWGRDLSYVDATGATRRATAYGRTEAGCNAAFRALRTKVESGDRPGAGGRQLFAVYADGFATITLPALVARGEITGKYAQDLTRALRLHVTPVLGATRLDRITTTQVRQVDLALIAKGRGTSLRRQALIACWQVFDAAVADRLVSANPARGVDLPDPVTATARVPHELPELAPMLARAADDRLGALVLFYAYTGRRRGEPLALTWDQLDLAAGTATVHRFKGRGREGSTQVIDLPAPLVTALTRHRQAQLLERLAASSWARPDLVFTTGLGTPLDGRAAYGAVKRVTGGHVHLMRHTYATQASAAGVKARDIAEMLGISVAVLQSTYLHSTRENQAAAAAAVGARLAGAGMTPA
jgi:integrase